MSESYSLSEVFRMAEAIERNGSRFYRQAAEVVADDDVKGIMLQLAKAEDHHEALFAKMRQEACAQEEAHWHDPDGQAEAYIRSVGSAHVFNLDPNVAKLVASVQSAKSALQLALGFEKDTIAFFSALRDIVKEENQHQVDRLIHEEVQHIHLINQALAGLA